jgi:hypothetical protein
MLFLGESAHRRFPLMVTGFRFEVRRSKLRPSCRLTSKPQPNLKPRTENLELTHARYPRWLRGDEPQLASPC